MVMDVDYLSDYSTDDFLDEPSLDLSSNSSFIRDATPSTPIFFLNIRRGKFPVLGEHYASWHSIVLNAPSWVSECPPEERNPTSISERREMYKLLRLCLQLIERVEREFQSTPS